MAKRSNLIKCSFCGKDHSEVKKLVAGPNVYICDSCVQACYGIIERELGLFPRKTAKETVDKLDKIKFLTELQVSGMVSAEDFTKKVAEIINEPVDAPVEQPAQKEKAAAAKRASQKPNSDAPVP